ncbi:hypothetical protein [Variovorax sp. UC122_21]|uniref:hypothetical protein n=1 Tax=Variovorax sp. UC122_21 TaxID=3374554 RepID=UPI0037572F37
MSLSLAGGVSPLREMAAVQQEFNFADAGVVGMALLMAVVSLMMGIALPDRRFIAYAGYLVTLGLLFASSEGMPASLWLQDSPIGRGSLAQLLGLPAHGGRIRIRPGAARHGPAVPAHEPRVPGDDVSLLRGLRDWPSPAGYGFVGAASEHAVGGVRGLHRADVRPRAAPEHPGLARDWSAMRSI